MITSTKTLLFTTKIYVRALPLNSLWRSGNGRVYVNKRHQDYMYEIQNCLYAHVEHINEQIIHSGHDIYDEGTRFHCEYLFNFTDYFTKKGAYNKKLPDTSNCVKVIEDKVFQFLDLDDNQVDSVLATRGYGPRNSITISFYKILELIK